MKTATTLAALAVMAPSAVVGFAPSVSVSRFSTQIGYSSSFPTDEDLFRAADSVAYDTVSTAYSCLVDLGSGSAAGQESMTAQLERQEAELLCKLMMQATVEKEESEDFFFPKPNEESADAMRDAMKEATKTMAFESDGLMMVEKTRQRR